MTPRFLIADHDPVIREGCRRFLAARGFDVHVAGDALHGLELLRRLQPTVLVLDRHLLWGGCDGVLDCLCDDETPSPLTVLLTDGQCAGDLPEALQNRVTRAWSRPRDLHELEQFVGRLENVVREQAAQSLESAPLAVERVYS